MKCPKGQQADPALHPTVESWSDKDSQIHVSQPDGFLCKVALRAKVDLDPGRIYDILTEEDNTRIWSSIKSMPYRKVLEDDHMGRQKVEVEHIGEFRFLMFRGTLRTRLYVIQNRRSRTIEFRLKEAGFMRDFAGLWRIQPFTQETLDDIYGPPHPHHWLSPVRAMRSLQHLTDRRPEASLVTLEQSVQPNVHIPPPVDRFLRAITASQVKGLLADLRAEVKRIHQEDKSKGQQPPDFQSGKVAASAPTPAAVSLGPLRLTFF